MDVAAGLVFTLRIWEGQPHWEVARAFLEGYRHVMPLNASEIAGLRWLMRLRNAAAAVWWLVHDLDAGVVRNAPMRINYMRESVVFLEQHGECLRALHAAPLT
jgi:Ser/Thr protein kinase RdoA (MazF antagonist)